MSRKRTTFSTEFKTKIALEALRADKTIAEIANAYNLMPKNILNWKKQFIADAKLREDVRDYIEFYNHRRFHESLGYQKPMKVYYENITSNQTLKIKEDQKVA
ncbi:MAG: transposase [Epsilonproteobacteria bacterium]|nr:transposase [Campylobacterota bacterium]